MAWKTWATIDGFAFHSMQLKPTFSIHLDELHSVICGWTPIQDKHQSPFLEILLILHANKKLCSTFWILLQMHQISHHHNWILKWNKNTKQTHDKIQVFFKKKPNPLQFLLCFSHQPPISITTKIILNNLSHQITNRILFIYLLLNPFLGSLVFWNSTFFCLSAWPTLKTILIYFQISLKTFFSQLTKC